LKTNLHASGNIIDSKIAIAPIDMLTLLLSPAAQDTNIFGSSK